MASSIMHMVVASELNKKLKRNNDLLIIGTIAPDLSKQIGELKRVSHFQDSEDNSIPNLSKFLDKYKEYLNDDFVLGYYIHLYTDYLWFKYFIPEIFDNSTLKELDGQVIECDKNQVMKYIYNDYTNINYDLISNYDLDINIFSRDIPSINHIIEEIPIDKINIIMEQCHNIVNKATSNYNYVFDTQNIKQFISMCVSIIENNLNDLEII